MNDMTDGDLPYTLIKCLYCGTVRDDTGDEGDEEYQSCPSCQDTGEVDDEESVT